MNESKQKFRDRLLNAEKSVPTEKYRKEMAELQERHLPTAQRTVIGIVSMLSLASAGYMGWLAVTLPPQFPLGGRLGLGFGAACGVLLGFLAARTVQRGTMKRKSDPNWIAGTIFMCLLVFAIIMLMLMGGVADAGKRVEMASTALFFFLMGCMFLILTRLEQTELRTREKLLELQLQVEQLAEQTRKPAGSAS